MNTKEQSTEQSILDAAEKIFISNGFRDTNTIDIAKEAGVTHAMLHYYYRTKENIFNLVFENVSIGMTEIFDRMFEKDLLFMDRIELGISSHFNRIAKNKDLPFFIYSEILRNEDRRNEFLSLFLPTIDKIMTQLQQSIDLEVNKGSIRSIKAIDLMLNIASLNVTSVLASPFFENENDYNNFLKHA